jgi:hypothetical protein
MSEQARPIRCHYFRGTPEPCMEPATVKVLGPEYTLLCEEHARYRIAENMPERWEQVGALEYARDCEDAASKLHRLMAETSTGSALYEILAEAETYLETLELPRARAALVATGVGTPRPTEAELEDLRTFEEHAQQYGWTDEPEWVPRIREWAREAAAQ